MLKAGYAQEVITPPAGVGLAGYFNERPNTGMYDDLLVKIRRKRQGAMIIWYHLGSVGSTAPGAVIPLASKEHQFSAPQGVTLMVLGISCSEISSR